VNHASSAGPVRWTVIVGIQKGGYETNRRFAVCCVAFALLALAAVPGAGIGKQGGAKWAAGDSWTIAVYVSGDNNLERFWDDISLPGLLNLPANDMLTIVAYVDRLSTVGTDVVEISGSIWEVNATYDEMDFGSGETFEWFLNNVSLNYASDKLAVIAWDHGYAWRYISDDVTSGGSRISMPELRTAIDAAGVFIDILAFDACNMAAMEVAYEVSLTGLVDLMVASGESVPTTGYPYDTMFLPVALDTSRTPSQVAVDMVEAFRAFYEPQTWASTVSLSAISIPSILASADTFVTWAGAMRSCLPLYASSYKEALKTAYFAWCTHYQFDMADFGETLLADPLITDADLRASTMEMVAAIDGAAIAVWGGPAAVDSRGLTLWWGVGGEWKWDSPDYAEVAFAIDTGWWAFLDEYN
jgi:hypothetical protein